MTMTAGRSILLLAFLALINLVGCDPAMEVDEATAKEPAGRAVADALGFDREAVSYGWQSAELSTKADMSEPDSDPECEWALAYVTVGGVTTVDKVLMCGKQAFVRVPSDPALIGLPLTVWVPGVGSFTGVVQ